MLGADLAWSDSKRQKALERIGAFIRLVRVLGGHGLIAVLDEAETIDQLWNRLSRVGAYETLGALCTQPHALLVFGITRRFDRCIASDVARGSLNYAPPLNAARFFEDWQSGCFEVIEPPPLESGAARELAMRIIEAYAMAYPSTRAEEGDVETALTRWRSNPNRNPRRLVRVLIDRLDAKRALPMDPICASN